MTSNTPTPSMDEREALLLELEQAPKAYPYVNRVQIEKETRDRIIAALSQSPNNQVEAKARELCAANFAAKGCEGPFGTVDDCWWAFEDEARAALSPKVSIPDVEAVALELRGLLTARQERAEADDQIGWEAQSIHIAELVNEHQATILTALAMPQGDQVREAANRLIKNLGQEGGTNYLGPATCRAISDLRAALKASQ